MLVKRMIRSRWMKRLPLLIVPLILFGVLAERASWHPKTLRGARGNVFQIVFSPDGSRMAVAAQNPNMTTVAPGLAKSRIFDDAIDIWDVGSRDVIRRIEVPKQSLGSIAWSPDGRVIAGLCSRTISGIALGPVQSTLKQWDVASGKLKRSFRVRGDYPTHLSFWSDADTLTYLHQYEGVKQWNAKTGKSKGSPLPPYAEAVAYSPDGKTIARREDAGLSLWNARTHKMQRRLVGNDGQFTNIFFGADSQTLVASGNSWSDDGNTTFSIIQVWDTKSGKQRWQQKFPDPGLEENIAITLSPDGTLLASANDRALAIGSDQWIISLRDARTGKLLRKMKGHRALINSLVFSPDGATLASGSADGTAKLWRIK